MHKKLEVWQVSTAFVTDVYRITKNFPSDERFGLTNQLRRASVSIPSNIAEGAARQTDKELMQFLYIALGSCAEVETQLIIARNLGYVNEIDDAMSKLQSIKKMLLGLIKYKQRGHN